MYLAHGLTLALTWFIVTSAGFSWAVAAVAGRLVDLEGGRAPSPRGWFALRMCPSVAAFLFVTAVFVPSYWRFEPRQSAETLDVTIVLGAAAAVAMIALAAARGVAASRAVARRTRDWMSTATPLATDVSTVPAFLIQTPAPLMALAGVFRPRMFVSAQLAQVLSPEELAATIAHEVAHWHAADNLKRLTIRLAPDFLGGTSIARRLERRWASAVEQAADDRGTAGDPALRCALASALLKVARLMPKPAPVLEPISTLVGGGELASRIERLLDEPAPGRMPCRSRTWVATAAVALALPAAYGPLLHAIHEASELLVNNLP